MSFGISTHLYVADRLDRDHLVEIAAHGFEAIEVLGLSPVGMASVPQADPAKEDVAVRAGRLVMDQLERGLRPSDILTRQSFLNGIASAAGTGGSTNIVLHFLAMAREAGIPLTIDDFNPVSDNTPIVADLKPSGRPSRSGSIQDMARSRSAATPPDTAGVPRL